MRESIFNETATQARALASDRLPQAIRASHGPRASPQSQAKERVKGTMENSKDSPKDPKVPKAHARVRPRKLVSQVLKTRKQKQARKLRNQCKWVRFIPLTRRGFRTNGVLTNGTTAGVWMNGIMTGVVLDGMKTERMCCTTVSARPFLVGVALC